MTILDILRPLAKHSSRIFMIFSQFLLLVFVINFAVWYGAANGLEDRSGTPLGADFLNVYAAGLLTNLGQPALAYDWHAHSQMEQATAGYPAPYFGWHYPPLFLGVAALFALVPYLWAFTFYMLAGFASYGAVLRRLVPQGKEFLWAIVSFPGVIVNISNGQNGFITTALFGAGFLWLEERPWLAGALFGLMSYKPQFFMVIPVALALGGYGRAFLAAILTAIGGGVFSWVLFGAVTWQAFFHSLGLTQHVILEQGSTGWKKIQSVFSLVRMWDFGITEAYILQGLIAAAALMCMAWVWRRRCSLAARAGSLCAALLLTTPYVLDYDLVLLAVPLALLTREGLAEGFLPYEKIILASLWMWPLLARSFGAHYVTLTPPLLMALMGICLIRARLSRSSFGFF